MTPRDAATERQISAADPGLSTWLSANAGSGKTRVLTDRVARLLLEGTDPAHILCLTYTKAAASEMQNRLFRRLADWAMLPDDRLAAALVDLGLPLRPDRARLARARRLFAQAMEVPGGLRIQTIHSFCAGLLRRFPLEAGVSPGFTEMQDREAERLRETVCDELAEGPEAARVEAIARLMPGVNFDTILAEIIGKKVLFAMASEADLRATIGVPSGLTERGLIARALGPDGADLLDGLGDLLTAGSTNDLRAREKLLQIDPQAPMTLEDLATLEGIFLFGDSAKTPFGAKIGSFPTKALRQREPTLCAALDELMERVAEARQDRLRLVTLGRSLAMLRFAEAFLPAYEARKAARGLLDFDDLISRSAALLTDPAVAAWVLWRLDGGIDHILVDEAQDTSPAQWAVIERLAQEFAAGDGADPGRQRSIFVVGDKKQSIYSFQGADPEQFDRMRQHFAQELARVKQEVRSLSLDHSFRSAPAVLRVVDLTFQGEASEGLGGQPAHIAFHQAMPGRVDLWPALEKTAEEEREGDWTDPVDLISPADPKERLSVMLADRIAELLATGTVPQVDKGVVTARRVRPRDILILVRRRSGLFGPLLRALKRRELPVAGADRLRVGAELAVRDLLALLRVLALPEDDLALAETLRSPLMGWSERELFHLAHPRPAGMTLWQALRRSPGGAGPMLDDLRSKAEFLRPYDLLMRILVRHDGRRRVLARLGAEAEEGIDALLAQALAYESRAVPGLTGFLEWVVAERLEVKRQVDQASDLIRVMTVHGAKGLEAPIVILPETEDWRIDLRETILPQDGVPLWLGGSETVPDNLSTLREDLKAAQERERRRLLYVAMTRAESWLILCAGGPASQGLKSWHGMVAEGMAQAGTVPLDTPTGPGLRHASGDWDGLPMAATAPVTKTAEVAAPVFAAVETPPRAPGTLSPSDLGGAKTLPGDEMLADPEGALARGSFCHLLLEHLPALPEVERPEVARRLAVLAEPVLTATDVATCTSDVLRLLQDPALAPIWAPTALPEVPVTGSWNGQRLAGIVDRLILSPGAVTVVDFKTNRVVPGNEAETPEGILRQMGAYRHILAQIYPDRRVIVQILWMATGNLMNLSEIMTNAALARATLP